ncbi:MAG: dienelactone hydrolase family protein [Candidatus Eisenbacteria bacterium]|nr:dienelactone hydrolase family protein [Candidatus Eisenbacteria bacterium]
MEAICKWAGAVLLVELALVPSSAAKLVTQTVTYEHQDTVLEGHLVFDDAWKEPRPGVLVVHQWMGLSENERMRAQMLAELGYVALAADVYGQGVRPANTAEAGAQASLYRRDRTLFRGRLRAALARLRATPRVDDARVAAIGYCFGGGGVLELARSGAPLSGVVSFHGNLDTPDPGDAQQIAGKVLVCHGAADPHVSDEALLGFVDEMEAADIDYQIILYGGAVHAFTQKDAGDDPSGGVAYDAAADRRSWRHMQLFFREIF